MVACALEGLLEVSPLNKDLCSRYLARVFNKLAKR